MTSPHILFRRLAAAAAICLGVAPSLRATTVAPPAFDQLVGQSDYIVRAVVKSVRTEMETNEHGRRIHTFVELDVKEVIAGTPPTPLVLRLLGGKVGEEEMIVQGAPQFQVGDEDILFIHGNNRMAYPLVGIMHGRYPIRQDKVTSRRYVVRSNGEPILNPADVARP